MLWQFAIFLVVASHVEGLQCPSCTYFTTTADIPSMFRTMIAGVLGLFQDDECSKPYTRPVKQIKEQKCDPGPQKEARCSFYDGDLTLKVPIVGIEIPFKIYQRGCYDALPSNIPANGCHPRNSINEDKTFLKHMVDETTDALSSWDVANFDGKLCLCSSTYCTGVSGVSQGAVLYPMLLMFQIALLYIL